MSDGQSGLSGTRWPTWAHIGRDHAEQPVGSGDWFGDLNKGIDVFAEMIKKYWPLFHPGELLLSATPDLDLNWIRMFQTAWYGEDFVPVTRKIINEA